MCALQSCKTLSSKWSMLASSCFPKHAVVVPGNLLSSYLHSSFHIPPCQSQLRVVVVEIGFLPPSRHVAVLAGHAMTALPLPVTCGSLLVSPWFLVLNPCSAQCCVGEAVKFFSLHAGVWQHVVDTCYPDWFFKMLQTKVRAIILSLSLKANFWITDENNIARIPHMPAHPAI